MNSENSINFLDINIFLNKDEKIEFKKYRKNSLDTVMTNFEESISSPKYKKVRFLQIDIENLMLVALKKTF